MTDEDDKMTREFIGKTCENLTEEDFQFSVDARGTPWDVYYFTAKGYRGTVAFRIVDEKLEIGLFRRGELTPETVTDALIAEAPN